MNKTFYKSFNDLNQGAQSEILEEMEQWVEEQLKQEARENLEKQAEGIVDDKDFERLWEQTIKELYDFESDQEINNFIMEKAQDIITTAFKKVPITINLYFK